MCQLHLPTPLYLTFLSPNPITIFHWNHNSFIALTKLIPSSLDSIFYVVNTPDPPYSRLMLCNCLLHGLSLSPPLRCESSPGFYPFFSAFVYLYSTLEKLAQSHDFKYFLYANNSQICFSSSDLSLKLLWNTAIWFSHICLHYHVYILTARNQESVSVSPSLSSPMIYWSIKSHQFCHQFIPSSPSLWPRTSFSPDCCSPDLLQYFLNWSPSF